MVSQTSDNFPAHRPAPLAWKEFRRRSGFTTQPKVYVYDSSPQIVPQSPPITPTLSPIINVPPLMVGMVGMESPRKEHSGYFLSHVSQALQALGASTGGNIAEYIANNFSNEFGVPYEKGRKLHYMVNAILSSPKYKYLFLKDQVLKDEKRSLWRLKKPGENADEDTTVPNDMSPSSLLPPTSPCLSLKISRDEIATVPAPSSSLASSSSLTSSLSSSSSTTLSSSINAIVQRESYGGGGSDEGEKPAGVPRTTEHPIPLSASLSFSLPLSSSSSNVPLSSSSGSVSSPTSPDPSSPLLGDAPSLSLSSRRKKRKGLDSSLGIEGDSPKQMDEPFVEEKKRRLDVAA